MILSLITLLIISALLGYRYNTPLLNAGAFIGVCLSVFGLVVVAVDEGKSAAREYVAQVINQECSK